MNGNLTMPITASDDPLNTMLLRGTRLLRGSYNNLTLEAARAALRYNLAVAMPALNDTSLPLSYFTNIVAEALLSAIKPISDPCLGFSNQERTFLRPLDGQPLYQWSYATLQERKGLLRDWGLLLDDTSAYDVQSSVPSTSWAMEDLMANITGWATQYYVRPKFGMSSITEGMVAAAEALREDAGLPSGLHLNRQFLGVRRVNAPMGRYMLTFAVTATNRCSKRTTTTDKLEYVYANEVVVAITQQALGKIRKPDNCLFGQVASALDFALTATVGINALKLYAVYDNATNWFNNAMHSVAGRHVHSEYGSQTFSWFPGTSAAATDVPAACADMTVLHMYDTGNEREKYWRNLQSPFLRDSLKCPDVPASLTGADLEAACARCFRPAVYYGPSTDGTPVILAEAVQGELAELTGLPLEELPEASRIIYKLWDDSTLDAGVTLWIAGARWWSIQERMRQPSADEAIYLVGESWASPAGQGWVEGALQTSERMLTLSMGIPPLSNISREDICRFNPLALQQLPETGPAPELERPDDDLLLF